jgi:hypothetical protein
MDQDRQKQLTLAARIHAQGAVLRLLLATLAASSRDQNEGKAWLEKVKGFAEQEVQNAKSLAGLTEEDLRFLRDAGLKSVEELFANLRK